MVTTSDLEADLELVKSAAVAAGIIAVGYFRSEPKTWTKPNASPVTEADLEVDAYLRRTLCEARSEYGWLSEESGEIGRLTRTRVFVVDPIDGTRAFLRGDDGWVISVAVVEAGMPLIGVIYAPARNELYEAVLGGGAKLNGTPLPAPLVTREPALIPAPRVVHQELASLGLAYERGPAISSLAFRLMQLAMGEVDAAVARRGAQDWDIAAATLILSEYGIPLEDVCAGPPVFNREATVHEALVAVRDPELGAVLRKAMKTVYGCPSAEQTATERERTSS